VLALTERVERKSSSALQVVEPTHGVAVRHSLEDVLEVGKRFDVIELCGGDERADGGPTNAAAGSRQSRRIDSMSAGSGRFGSEQLGQM
jgi:hypothetical protein